MDMAAWEEMVTRSKFEEALLTGTLRLPSSTIRGCVRNGDNGRGADRRTPLDHPSTGSHTVYERRLHRWSDEIWAVQHGKVPEMARFGKETKDEIGVIILPCFETFESFPHVQRALVSCRRGDIPRTEYPTSIYSSSHSSIYHTKLSMQPLLALSALASPCTVLHRQTCLYSSMAHFPNIYRKLPLLFLLNSGAIAIPCGLGLDQNPVERLPTDAAALHRALDIGDEP